MARSKVWLWASTDEVHAIADSKQALDASVNARVRAIVEELEQVVASVDPAALRQEIAQLDRLIVQARQLEQTEVETKLARLKEALRECVEELRQWISQHKNKDEHEA